MRRIIFEKLEIHHMGRVFAGAEDDDKTDTKGCISETAEGPKCWASELDDEAGRTETRGG